MIPARFRQAGLVLLVLCGATDSSAAQQPSLDSLITARMSQLHIPGLAVALLDSGRVVWTGAYGLADVAKHIPVTDSTPFQLASVSKTVTATALLTLFGAGLFVLDEDINHYLPFKVRHPTFPDEPITFRELLIHRSGIVDNSEYFRPLWNGGRGDDSLALEDFLREYLTRDGQHYSKEKNFLPVRPGERVRYCNTCYALLGFLAERISRRPYQQFSRDVLFQPLGMRETGWFMKDFTTNVPAMPHRFAKDTGFVATGPNGYPDWPAGTLRSSIRDMGRFLSMYLNDGAYDGKTVVKASVINAMAPDDFHLGFLTWWLDATPGGKILYSHEGGDVGVRTFLGFSHEKKRGVIVLTNGEAGVSRLAGELFDRIPEIRHP